MTPQPFSQQLFTDFYQLTMAYGYWKSGRAELPALFVLYFRANPFRGGYCVAAGLEQVCQLLDAFCFSQSDLEFIGAIPGSDGKPLFEKAFLAFLASQPFACDVEAVPEGTLVFPNEPVVKVRGPLWQAQWIETLLLNTINFQSLIATKASRIVSAARGGEVVEFGLRRAQGIDGGMSATRASYIGGVAGTSNLLATQRFTIPLRGTHAHSWVMSFPTESEAFDKYAAALPDNCALLIDTFDSVTGVKSAIETGKKLKAKGKALRAVRLDSGDFAYLSQVTRKLLDDADLRDVKIIASNELDEYLIQSLHFQEAKIDIWGVGTKLVTAQDQPAMNGIYKLTALFEDGKWQPKIKVSDQPTKTTNPGAHRIARFLNSFGEMEGDLIFDESEQPGKVDRIIDPILPHRTKKISPRWEWVSLLKPIYTLGKRTYDLPNLESIRLHLRQQLAHLHPGHKRLENPHSYVVGLSPYLADLKTRMIESHSTRGTAQ